MSTSLDNRHWLALLSRFARRGALSLFVIWGVVTLTFVVNHTLPGDPARAITGPQARPADVDRVRRQLGLDRSLFAQYTLFAGRLLHGGPAMLAKGDKEHASCSAFGRVHLDLGMSYQRRQPVAKLLGEKLPPTLLLAFSALLVQLTIGVTLGAVAAMRRGSAVDHTLVGLALLGISVPTFLSALGLQWLFAFKLRLLPFDGFGTTLGERALSTVLPALTLGIFGAAYTTRLVRAEVIAEKQADYVRTAYAKGASASRVLVVHILRNTLIPLVTVVGLELGALVGGAIVTEKIFRWPGLGGLSVDAVLTRDGPVVMGTVIVASTAVVLASALVDVSYALLDPRARRPG